MKNNDKIKINLITDLAGNNDSIILKNNFNIFKPEKFYDIFGYVKNDFKKIGSEGISIIFEKNKEFSQNIQKKFYFDYILRRENMKPINDLDLRFLFDGLNNILINVNDLVGGKELTQTENTKKFYFIYLNDSIICSFEKLSESNVFLQSYKLKEDEKPDYKYIEQETQKLIDFLKINNIDVNRIANLLKNILTDEINLFCFELIVNNKDFYISKIEEFNTNFFRNDYYWECIYSKINKTDIYQESEKILNHFFVDKFKDIHYLLNKSLIPLDIYSEIQNKI